MCTAGGHSLLANKLVAALSSRLQGPLAGRTVALIDLFEQSFAEHSGGDHGLEGDAMRLLQTGTYNRGVDAFQRGAP